MELHCSSLHIHKVNQLGAIQFPRSEGSSLCPTPERVEQLQFPRSLSSLIEKRKSHNDNLVNIFPSYELLQLQKLEKLHVEGCHSVVEVFEVVEGTNNEMNETPTAIKFPELREMTVDCLYRLRYIWKYHEWIVLEFPNLTEVSISNCRLLQHVFTCSMVGSLVQLQEPHISCCSGMEVIVKEADVAEEDDEARSKGHALPCLRSLKLEFLQNLKGFCLGNNAFIYFRNRGLSSNIGIPLWTLDYSKAKGNRYIVWLVLCKGETHDVYKDLNTGGIQI